MSDADDDGFHINSLVISLLYKYLPDLFKKGMVYALDSANCKYYAMDTRDNYYFGSTVDDVKEKIIKAKAKLNGKVSYLKGWGELDPAGLRISALDKNTRSLIKLNPLTTKGYDNLVGLMGEDSTMRKELLGV
jgi:DNA gyrase subunit B